MLHLRQTLCRARVLLPLAALIAAVWWWHPWQHPITIVERVNPRDGAAMVWVPAGSFAMGRNAADAAREAIHRRHWRGLRDALWQGLRGRAQTYGEEPVHTVSLDGYWIYTYEVTVGQYRAFCRATGRQMPPVNGENHPVVYITWDDARAYAAWAGAALPTEAQWEKAARGTDRRPYPWGNTWQEDGCVHSAGTTQPVGSRPRGASPCGAHDMAGNVEEWCADWYDDGYYPASPARNPAGPAAGTHRVVRGGHCFDYSPGCFYASNRRGNKPANRTPFIGFRCVVNATGPK